MLGRKRKQSTPIFSFRKYLLPAGYLILSVVLMVLPLEGVVSSFKVVLAYIFLPQVRAAHQTVTYVGDVSQTVRELLDAHAENRRLKQQIENNQLLVSQAAQVLKENKRLTEILQLPLQDRWQGVWAKIAYRDPTQWNTVTLDKGSREGIKPRSAVIAVEDGQSVLVGVVVETTETTAKVLLVRDEDFSAAVYLENSAEEGLLTGDGPRPVKIQYLPLQAKITEGEGVFTSASSSIFPAGIFVGRVLRILENDIAQTTLTLQVEPAIHPASIKEVFVLTEQELL